MKYTVQAAARATGVSESRLRTWERRYGVPRPGRSATGRRLYEEHDLAVVRRMAALVASGVPAAQAAEAVSSEIEDGRVLEQPQPRLQHPLVDEIAAATTRYDEQGMVRALQSAVAELEWGPALDTVIYPALVRVGVGWEQGDLPLACEHFCSELVRRELMVAIAAVPEAEGDAPVALVACPEDERHDLGALGLSLGLRREGLRVVYLGADVPAGELAAAASEVAPDVICLCGTAPSSAPMLAATTRMLIRARQSARLFVGGPALGHEGAVSVAGVRLPKSIVASTALIAEAAREAAPAEASFEADPRASAVRGATPSR